LSEILPVCSVPTKILLCQRVPKKISGFSMLNNGKVKNESALVPNKNAALLKKKSA